MKTLYTTLPFYDRLAKQCYQRSNRTGEIYPIKSPRHRLPSFLINTETDNPGEIADIQIYDENDILQYTKDSGSYGWYNVFGAFDTFNTDELDIISAIQLDNADAYAFVKISHLGSGGFTTGSYLAKAGETLRVTGDYTHISGAINRFCIFDVLGFGEIDGINLTDGAIDYEYTFLVDQEVMFLIHQIAWLATNFSFINVSIKLNNGTSHFNTTESYIQSNSAWDRAWDEATDTYNTFASVGYNITSAIKTVAAGENYGYNWIFDDPLSVPANIVIGDVIRIIATLTLNSGSAPKMELRNTGTGAAISNTVTLAVGVNYVMLKATATLASGWKITIFNSDTELSNFSVIFSAGEKTYLPKLYTTLTNDYFQYNGEILGSLLPCGTYYLKITTVNSYVYYSEMITVTDIYNNLISELTNIDYDTFISFETKTFSAINIAGTATCISNIFNVIKGEQIKIIFFLTLNSGANPYARIHGLIESVYQVSSIGLNEITLTITWSGIAQFLFHNEAASNFSTSEILVIRQYSEKYLTINFSNSCDIGDLLYATGFEQTVYIESETMETTFPQEEEGQKNGEGKFIRTFARQVKKYNVKAGAFPDYMIDVFNRMRLHDTIELIDIVGNENDLYNLEVENEWLPPGKYYANISLTFDYDEAVVVSSCCVNLT